MKSCCCSCSCCVRMTRKRKRKHGAVFPGVFCASGGGVAFVDRGTSTAIACDPASPPCPCPCPCLGSRSSTAADACAGVDVEGDDSCQHGAGEMNGANIRATDRRRSAGSPPSSSSHGMEKGGGLGRCRGCAPTRTARSVARHRSTLGPEQSSPRAEKKTRHHAGRCRAGVRLQGGAHERQETSALDINHRTTVSGRVHS